MTILQMILTVAAGMVLSTAATLGVCALVVLRQEVERAHKNIEILASTVRLSVEELDRQVRSMK